MASKTVVYAAIAVVVIVVAFGGYYYWMGTQSTTPPPGSNTGSNTVSNTASITIYGGEVSASSYGWGLTQSKLTSPGPTLNMTVGTTYKLTFNNVGQFPHAFVIKNANSATATTMWNAAVGSASAPITAGQSGSVTFTPTQAGTYYYLCPVPGHDDLGMWGMVKVT